MLLSYLNKTEIYYLNTLQSYYSSGISNLHSFNKMNLLICKICITPKKSTQNNQKNPPTKDYR